MDAPRKYALLLLLGIACLGCRVTSPQYSLREGASWFPPKFTYLKAKFNKQRNFISHDSRSHQPLLHHEAAPHSQPEYPQVYNDGEMTIETETNQIVQEMNPGIRLPSTPFDTPIVADDFPAPPADDRSRFEDKQESTEIEREASSGRYWDLLK